MCICARIDICIYAKYVCIIRIIMCSSLTSELHCSTIFAHLHLIRRILSLALMLQYQSLKTRMTRLDPRSSKLENFKYQVSSWVLWVLSWVVWVLSQVVRVSSWGDKEFIAPLIFPNTCTCQSCWFAFGDREIFESRL